VIAVFPLKTGDSMFVGFDSQNTSHNFLHYTNWRRKEPNLAIGNQTNLVTPGTAIGASGASPHSYLGGERSSLD